MKKTACLLTLIMSLSLMLPAVSWADDGALPNAETNEQQEIQKSDSPQTAQPEETEPAGQETLEYDPDTWLKIFEQDELIMKDLIPEDVWKWELKTFSLDAFSRNVSAQCVSSAKNPIEDQMDKEVVREFWEGLSQFRFMKTTDPAPKDVRQYADVNLSLSNFKNEGFSDHFSVDFILQDDIITFEREYSYRVNDSEGLFQYLSTHLFYPSQGEKEPKVASYYDPAAGTIRDYDDSEAQKYRLIDRMTFDINIDNSYYDTEFEEITGGSGIVHCTLTHFFKGRHYFILTLEGSAETREYFLIESGGQFDIQRNPCFEFFCMNRVADGKMVQTYSHDGLPRFKIFGDAKDGSIKNVRIEYESNGCREIKKSQKDGKQITIQVTPPNPVQAENFEYKLLDEEALPDETAYAYLFNDVPPSSGTPEPTQDPTRYKIELRKEYDTHTEDFYIDLATRYRIDTSVIGTPDWVKEIGADESAEVTFINIVTTENGKYHLDNPTIKIKGKDGEKWFWLSAAQTGRVEGDLSSEVDDDRTIWMRLNSCLSFDGFTVIRNMQEYDSISLRFVFTSDEKKELDYMEIDFGGNRVVKTPAEQINYVGDCNAVYEKWMKGGL